MLKLKIPIAHITLVQNTEDVCIISISGVGEYLVSGTRSEVEAGLARHNLTIADLPADISNMELKISGASP